MHHFWRLGSDGASRRIRRFEAVDSAPLAPAGDPTQMDQGDMDMTVKAPLHTGDVSDGGFADVLASAVEKLRNGVLEEAHRLLVRLIRKHNTDADVIFNLAVARKRLGYDVSAEALFTQAFENGYAFPSDSPAVPIESKPSYFRWTDPTDTVAIIVRQLPRRSALTFVGFDRKAAQDPAPSSAEAEVSDAEPASE